MTTLTTADGASTTLDDEKLAAFRNTLRGDLILNDHAAYESARRVWNGNIDRRPALIARCTGVADVQRAVTLPGHTRCGSRFAMAATARRGTAPTMAAW